MPRNEQPSAQGYTLAQWTNRNTGAPILNDPFYGDPELVLRLSDLKRSYKGREDEKPLIGRLALHASELTLKHPSTREPITLQAPLPHEFEVALKYLRKFAAVVPSRPKD